MPPTVSTSISVQSAPATSRRKNSGNFRHAIRGAGKWEWILILVLLIILVLSFFPALEKMLDQGAVSEMRQASIYLGRSVQTEWGKLEAAERAPIPVETAIELAASEGREIAPQVSFAQEVFVPGGTIQLRHVRFDEKVFSFDYEGILLPDSGVDEEPILVIPLETGAPAESATDQ